MNEEKNRETDIEMYLKSCESSLSAIIDAMVLKEKQDPEIKSEENKSLIQLPFLPISVRKTSIKSLWLNTGKLIVNGGNPSSMDLIVDNSSKITRAIIHRTNKQGLIISQEDFPVKKLPFHQIPQGGENLKLYEDLNNSVKSYLKSELGNIRVVPREILVKFATVYSNYQTEGKSDNLFALIGEYINLLIAYVKESKLIIYPLPPALDFLLKIREYLGEVSFYEVLQKIGQILPRQKFVLTFWDNKIYIPFKITTDNSSFTVDTLSLPSNVTNTQQGVERNSNILHYLRKTYKCRYNFIIHLPEYIDLVDQLLNTEFPISLSRISYLIQNSFCFQRKVGFTWDLFPKPQLYDPTFKFWTKSFGFLLNPNKIAYWAFPEMIMNALLKEFGLNSKMLLLFEPTISENSKILADKNVKAAVISLVNGTMEEIVTIPSEMVDGFLPRNQESGKIGLSTQIKAFRDAIIPTYGIISHTIWLNYDLLQQIVGINLLWGHKTKLGYFKVLKLIRLLQNSKDFQILPTPLSLKQIKKTPPSLFLYRLGGVLSDSIEF